MYTYTLAFESPGKAFCSLVSRHRQEKNINHGSMRTHAVVYVYSRTQGVLLWGRPGTGKSKLEQKIKKMPSPLV